MVSRPRIWMIDAREGVLDRIEAALAGKFGEQRRFTDARQAVVHIRREVPDLVIMGLVDNTIAPGDLIGMREAFIELSSVPVVVVFGDDDVITVEEVMQKGGVEAVALERLEAELARRCRWLLAARAARSQKGQRWSLDFLSRVIEASPNAIVAARRDGEIVLFNSAAEKILGWSKAQALGMGVRRLYPEGGAQRIMEKIRSADHGGVGQIDSLREVVVSADGDLIPVEISAALIEDEGQEMGTVGIFIDLRRQVRMEERLEQAVEALEQTQRQAVIAEVAGAAAHKLNQPLTSLLGYTEFLRRQIDEDDELYRVVSTIYEDAQAVAGLVRRIGRISRYRTREYAGGEKIVDLDEACDAEETPEGEQTIEVGRAEPGRMEGDGDYGD